MASQARPSPPPLARARSTETLVGRTLAGTYRVIRTLDRGGVGVVYEAEHVRLHRGVAVKVLAPPLSRDPRSLARFEREAAIVSQLRHPHVVQILDHDWLPDGSPFVVMELLRGESLSRRLAKRKRLALPEVMRIVEGVASALSAAHEAGIVHRDLKPGNIFLMRMAAGAPFVKLLDFGISKALQPAGFDEDERELLGTPCYMAPEQVLLEHVDGRTDQYALGVVAWEALTGVRPFQKRNLMTLLHEIVVSPPSWMDFDPSEVPPEVEAVLQRAMAKAPEQRFPSVMEFAFALETAAMADLEPAPTSNAQQSVEAELTLAAQAFELGLIDQAGSHVEVALSLADSSGDRAARAHALAARELVDRIFDACLGSLETRLQVVTSALASRAGLLPEETYLLSRFEGEPAVDDVLEVSPMPRRQTLRILLALMQKGVIRLT